ncbi:MAG TPA: response regulator [Trebonia sp.]|jgi:DNA-binding response OmpR family regulator|nr:response regulator [Trebonia sp.]
MSLSNATAAPRGRILVVEDDPDAAVFAVHVLTKLGRFHVTCTPDPVAALELARRETWDLVITDLELPGMSGTDMLAVLRRTSPGLPSMILTAQAHLIPQLAGEADKAFAKPVSAAALVESAEALVGRHRDASADKRP